MMTSADAVRSLVREVLFGEQDDSQHEPIGPSPLEKVRATGDPVSFQSDISKIKDVVAKVQSSPLYQVGTAAWSGGLVGAAQAAGVHVPSALSKPGEFLTRPEVTTAIGAAIPGAGAAGTAATGIWKAATRGIGSEVGSQAAGMAGASGRYVPKLDPVAAHSTPSALATVPLSGKNPFKK
jgi:hypothetical protein